MAKELPVPIEVQQDPKSVEIIRVWIANGDQHFSIATDVWESPEAWGILLVDLANHISHSYVRGDIDKYSNVLKAIKQ